MFLDNNSNNIILSTINKYRKEYVKEGLLPELLYCDLHDGYHLPMIPASGDGESVYLYCITCGYKKEAGLVTADRINTYMRWRDMNPSEPFLTQC